MRNGNDPYTGISNLQIAILLLSVTVSVLFSVAILITVLKLMYWVIFRL